jgi:hypothetical protein
VLRSPGFFRMHKCIKDSIRWQTKPPSSKYRAVHSSLHSAVVREGVTRRVMVRNHRRSLCQTRFV